MSSTYIATFVSIALALSPAMGLNLNENDLTATVSTLAQVVAWGWVFFGRFRAGGLKWWGGRK